VHVKILALLEEIVCPRRDIQPAECACISSAIEPATPAMHFHWTLSSKLIETYERRALYATLNVFP